MKAYEILLLAKPIVEKLVLSDINPKDVKYLEVFHEYNRLKNEGHKVRWIAAYLSDEYDISEPNIFKIIKRLEKDI